MAHNKEALKEGCYGDDVREHILEFAANGGYEAIPEDERDTWFTRFKFWGLFHQRDGQESYFMMRLTNASGVLEPGQLRAIGEVAREYANGPVANPEFGNGWIDLTTRQSVQLHWLELEGVPEIWEELESVGVHSRSAGGDTMRNISGCPLHGKAEEFVAAGPLLERFEEELRTDDALANMPRKFNISVSGCTVGCAQDSLNDIGFEPATKEIGVSGEAGGSSDSSDGGEEVRGFNVRIGGGLGGRQPRAATPLDVFVRPENAYEVGRGFVELYHDYGDRQNRSKNRARFFAEDWGMAKIRETLQAEYVDFEMHTAGEDVREEYTYNAGKPVEAGQHDHVGVGDQKDGGNYVGLSVPVGRLPAEDAIELADLADEYGSGEVRLTRRQNPVIVDVAADDLEALLAEPLLETYPAEPSPFERGAMACTGTEFCSIALTETKARMARMLRWFNENVELPDDVGTIKMHYSGCTADCGQAMTADIGLQGMRARKDGEMVEAFDIGVGGGVGENPSFIDWVQQRVPADEAPGAIRNLLEAYAAHRACETPEESREDGDSEARSASSRASGQGPRAEAVRGQSFREWVDATAEEQLVEFCVPEETDFEAPYMADAKQSWYPFAEGDSAAAPAADDSAAPSDD
ncbi:nitrite/sulfite reductase [Natrinema pallidum]|uniref:Nitrite and sulfite reductase 4Fe-4S region n=1 Tax=Natrinema pallidum DSM 3751 TaxID=1227495 RepID=L9YWH2_9EURY|nr:nitrate/sulfite reductase [Natrinema pallidum]ELY78545.1 nitrite and sulfite reductase 4Fe-4S region [Natrinema pallidum DSM 3751]